MFGVNRSLRSMSPLVVACVAVLLSSCTPTREWPAELVALENDMLTLVNDVRATGATCPTSGAFPAVPPVVDNTELRWSARLHAEDMGQQAYFAHDSKDGREPWDRMEAAGYTADPVAENIAAGSDTAAATFEQWMTSDGHCQNILLEGTNELGVGVAHVEGSPFEWYWVQNFGFRG
jgi:uncharacterized protein YkwD